MEIRGQIAALSLATVAMCMVAALTGFALVKIVEKDAESPVYEITDVSDGGVSLPFDGTVSFEAFDESSAEYVCRFVISVSANGIDACKTVAVAIDSVSKTPFGYRPLGSGLWADDDGTMLELDGSGGIVSISVVSDGLAIAARRSP